MNNKKYAFLVLLLALGAIEFYKIEIPDKFDEPGRYRFNVFFFKVLRTMCEVAETLNIGTEPSNIRSLMNGLFKMVKKVDPNVKSVDMFISDINVRIYTPIRSVDKTDLPIMIFYHGGGFFMGSLDFYDVYLNELVDTLNIKAISVDYRMAPENPYPAPTSDCYTVTKYVMESGNEFGDTNRVILAGDSAGGNAVAVVSQRLLAENLKQPKLQVLIYPWLQMFDNKLPSSLNYPRQAKNQGKFMAWYLGHSPVSEELDKILTSNLHTTLIETDLREKLKSFTDHKMIPEQYKAGKDYYKNHELIDTESLFPERLESSSILNTDKNLRDSLRKLFSADLSPGLAEPEKLVGLPKALFISCEVDPIKDHGLIYAERLRKTGVEVQVNFYEDCFHGSVTMTDKDSGFKASRNILRELIYFLEKSI